MIQPVGGPADGRPNGLRRKSACRPKPATAARCLLCRWFGPLILITDLPESPSVRLKLLRVVGRLPMTGVAARWVGRRRTSLKGGNRGTVRLGGASGYGDSGGGVLDGGPCGVCWIARMWSATTPAGWVGDDFVVAVAGFVGRSAGSAWSWAKRCRGRRRPVFLALFAVVIVMDCRLCWSAERVARVRARRSR